MQATSDDRQRAQIERLLAGLPGGDQGRDGGRQRADEKAAKVLEEGVDQRDVDLGRQRLCLSRCAASRCQNSIRLRSLRDARCSDTRFAASR